MAADTANKRRAILVNLPEPDGTIDALDRRQTIWGYPVSALLSSAEEVVNAFAQIHQTTVDVAQMNQAVTAFAGLEQTQAAVAER